MTVAVPSAFLITPKASQHKSNQLLAKRWTVSDLVLAINADFHQAG
jgi:hypothetical protein